MSHGVHDPEEFPFLEEVHILRRLQVLVSKIILIILFFIIDFQATLFAVVNWDEAKSASHVQAWNVS